MDIYGYISAIAVFVYTCQFLIFLAVKKNRVVRQFLVLLFTMICWTGGSLLMRWQMPPNYVFWYHVSLGGLLLMSYAYYRFMNAFVDRPASGTDRIYLVVLLAVFLGNIPSGFFMRWPVMVERGDQVEFVYDAIQWPVVFLFLIEGAVILHGVNNLIGAYRDKPYLRGQLRPVIWGIAILFLGHAAMLLPVFSGFPVDILVGIVNAVLLVYALAKKRLFKLQLLASESVCYMVGLCITLVLFLYLQPYCMSALSRLPGGADYAVLLFAALFLFSAVAFTFLWKRLANNLFVREENHLADALREYSLTVSQLLDVDDILQKTVDTIKTVPGIDNVYICVLEAGAFKARCSNQPLHDLSFALRADCPLLSELRDQQCVAWKDFENTVAYRSMWQEEKERFRILGVHGALGLLGDSGEMQGVVLFTQRTGQHIRMRDMQWLPSVASVTSIALKNAKLYEQACHEARTDELTGLYNRKYFYEILEREFAANRESTLSLIIINIDDFKLYNQLYGAAEGDRALRNVARVLQNSVGDNGYVARYTSKEFAVLLPRYDVLATRALAESIQRQVYNMNRATVDRKLKVLTVSIGISAAPFDASTSKQLLENADMAVYHVKRSGKNAIEVFDAVLRGDVQDEKVDHRHIYQEYEPTVVALTAAIDAKDHYTFTHSRNVAYYATELARAAGLNNDFVEIIRQAALLHDIGKIGIPETVLNKTGKLTEDEYELMQGHVEASIGIIRHLPALDYIIPAVIGHHERYDGRGYPRRIGGEDIPLAARILCVADSFDAMTSRRCYKPAVPLERAIQILEEESGRQFDPKLAPLFVDCLREGKVRLIGNEPAPVAAETTRPQV